MPAEDTTLLTSEPAPDWRRDRHQVAHAAGFVTAAVIVAALYFASEVLIPITLAALLTFILAPLVDLLRGIRIPRVAAIIATVLLALGIIVGVGAIIGTQVADLAGQLPEYQTTLESKVTKLRDSTLAPLSRAVARFRSRSEQQSSRPPAQNPSANAPASQKPVPVVIQQPTLSPVQVGQNVIAPILHPAATLLIMLVVTVFTLLYREDIRDRAIRLFGASDLSRTTAAMDDAGNRLSRYFIAQLSVNSAFGIAIGVGTYFIGVPHPVLWGVMGAVLRFVPYIGAWIAAALPTLLAAAVDPGWSMALMTIGLYACIEFFAGQILEPLIYGHSTGLSPIAVIIAAIFWTWLWGAIGLIISTPLTLCAVVLGRHFEPLSFIDILLGSRPALRPSESLYQRLLAGDVDEAQEQLEEFAKEHSLVDYYDDVAIETLQLASADFKSRKLSHSAAGDFRSTFEELIEFAQEVVEPKDKALAKQVTTAPAATLEARVLCLPGRGPFDALAAEMLSQLLERRGIAVCRGINKAVDRQKLDSIEMKEVALVCVLYLQARGFPAHARLLIGRLKQRNPQTKVILGLIQQSAVGTPQVPAKLDAVEYVASLKEALEIARRLTGEPGDIKRSADQARGEATAAA